MNKEENAIITIPRATKLLLGEILKTHTILSTVLFNVAATGKGFLSPIGTIPNREKISSSENVSTQPTNHDRT